MFFNVLLIFINVFFILVVVCFVFVIVVFCYFFFINLILKIFLDGFLIMVFFVFFVLVEEGFVFDGLVRVRFGLLEESFFFIKCLKLGLIIFFGVLFVFIVLIEDLSCVFIGGGGGGCVGVGMEIFLEFVLGLGEVEFGRWVWMVELMWLL